MTDKLIKRILIGFIIVLIIIIKVVSSGWQRSRDNYGQLTQLLADTSNHYEQIVTDQGKTINVQTQKAATLENAIAAGLIREDEMKEKNMKLINSVVRLTQQVDRLITVGIQDPDVVTITNTDTICPEGTFLRVPAKFDWSDNWLSLAGTITGPFIEDLSIIQRTEPTIMLGYQKQGFFKPLKPVVTVEDKNPYVHTISMENVVIQQKPPFYKTPWWHRGEGAVAIALLVALLNQ